MPKAYISKKKKCHLSWENKLSDDEKQFLSQFKVEIKNDHQSKESQEAGNVIEACHGIEAVIMLCGFLFPVNGYTQLAKIFSLSNSLSAQKLFHKIHFPATRLTLHNHESRKKVFNTIKSRVVMKYNEEEKDESAIYRLLSNEFPTLLKRKGFPRVLQKKGSQLTFSNDAHNDQFHTPYARDRSEKPLGMPDTSRSELSDNPWNAVLSNASCALSDQKIEEVASTLNRHNGNESKVSGVALSESDAHASDTILNNVSLALSSPHFWSFFNSSLSAHSESVVSQVESTQNDVVDQPVEHYSQEVELIDPAKLIKRVF